MERLLQSIGKAKFVSYFYQFKNLSGPDMTEILIRNGDSQKSAATRVSKANSLFAHNYERDALQNILQSRRVPHQIKESAQLILDAL